MVLDLEKHQIKKEENNMSGHSKWHNIAAKKGKADAARGKIFTKLGKAPKSTQYYTSIPKLSEFAQSPPISPKKKTHFNPKFHQN